MKALLLFIYYARLTFVFILTAATESFCDVLPLQEMAMRKVTRTLFQDDEDDDMVSASSVYRPLTKNTAHDIIHEELAGEQQQC